MTSFPVLIAVHEFIDWAQLIVLLMSIYYFIMFAVFQTDEEKEEDKQRAENFSEWVNSAINERKNKKDADKDKRNAKRDADKDKRKAKSKVQKRNKLLSPAKGAIINVVKSIDEMSDALRTQDGKNFRDAKTAMNSMRKNLRLAKNCVRRAWQISEGDIRRWMDHLHLYIDALEDTFDREVKNNMPTSETDSDWVLKVTKINRGLGLIRKGCGYLIIKLDKYINEGVAEEPDKFITTPPSSS